MDDKHLNILLENGDITKCKIFSQLQPIVSVVKKRIVGYEGLARGLNLIDNSTILPEQIFSAPKNIEEKIYLDRLCRDACFESFTEILETGMNQFIFVNIDTSIIKYVSGSSYLLNQVLKYGINPHNVVIEIKESMTDDVDLLIKFVDDYKSKGFLIALDDLGTGFCNFDRIITVKPDIIKIDRSLIENINNSYFKSEIFQSIVRLANRISALVVAEGVETFEESLKCIEYGAHFLQGYFFAMPQKIDCFIINNVEESIDQFSKNFKLYMKNKIASEKKNKFSLEYKVSKLINSLEDCVDEQFGEKIKQFLFEMQGLNLECAYILDEHGVQKTETYFLEYTFDERKKMMFLPALKGTDNSLKNYYYELINSKVTTYTSETYISSATGNTCVTISRIFKDKNSNPNILCIDKRYDYHQDID